MHRLLHVVRVALVAAIALAPAIAFCATITVDSTADTVAADANCTLREAITAANSDAAFNGCAAGSGADVINFTFAVPATIIVTGSPLPTITAPLTIDGPGGGASAPGVRIDGNTLSTGATDDEWGLVLGPGSDGSVLRDLMITQFNDGGIDIHSAGNAIRGNWIGTDGATAGLGNGSGPPGGGIRIRVAIASSNDAGGNVIGGSTPADRNLIEGNSGPGVFVGDYDVTDDAGVVGTVISGNYFGTNPSGTAWGPSGGGSGFMIDTYSATDLRIGGTTGTTPGGNCTGECNLIAGGAGGILVNVSGPSDGAFVTGIVVRGNYIGTDVTGNTALGCSVSCIGISMNYANSGVIGGTTAPARNVIAGLNGSTGHGIYLFNSVNGTSTFAPFTIEGNYIGVNSAGTAVLANGGNGIWTNPAEGLVIGGATTASRNVISGNAQNGIQIDGGNDLVNTGNTIQNNFIGVLPNGTTAAPNTMRGVYLATGVASVTDFALVQDNVIANNGGAGVAVLGNNNRIRTNSIYNNGSLGIDLDADGAVETNDACDPDSGGNDLQNFPVITMASILAGTITISGTLDSLPSSAFTLDFFGNTAATDQSRIYLGSTSVTTGAGPGCSGSFTFGPIATTLVPGNTVTVTATNQDSANSDTSELSAKFTVTLTAPISATKSFTPASMGVGSTSVLTITISNSNGFAATGVQFTDNYPPAITNAATPNVATTCGGVPLLGATSGTSTLTASGLTVPASSSCTVTVNVTASTFGTHTNTIAAGGISSSNAGATTSPTTASLTVNAAPTVSKSFNPSSIPPGGTTTLTITLTNPNTGALTGAGFTDNYPSGLVNASPANGATTCAGGVVTATAGGTSLNLASATIPASGSCTVTVNVTTLLTGNYQNTLAAGAVTTANSGPSGGAASAALAVATSDVPALSPPLLLLLCAMLALAAAAVLRQ